MDQKEIDELIDLFCGIPFNAWNKSATEFNGKKVILNKMHSGGNFYFTIDGMDFCSSKDDKGYSKTNTYGYALEEYISSKEKETKGKRQKEIYDHFK